MSAKINDAALRYLAYRSRSRAEMARHLAEKGYGETEIRTLLQDFTDWGYLDDRRFCREFLRYGFGKGWGRRRVAAELRKKGVDPVYVEEALADWTASPDMPDERSRAAAEAARICRMADLDAGAPVPEKILGRVGRNLANKGYDSDIIYSIIGALRRDGARVE